MAENKKAFAPVFVRILLFLLLAVGLVFFLPFSWFSLCYARVAADPAEKKQQIEKIEKDLDREREQLLKFDEKEEKLLEELSQLEKEIEKKEKASRSWRKKSPSSRKICGRTRPR